MNWELHFLAFKENHVGQKQNIPKNQTTSSLMLKLGNKISTSSLFNCKIHISV